MKNRSRGQSGARNPAIPVSAAGLPPGYPVGVHLGGVKTFGRMVRPTSADRAIVDVKGVHIEVPTTVLSTDAQSFSLVLAVRDGTVVEPRVFEHRQEALGYADRFSGSTVGPIPIDAPVALQLMRLIERRRKLAGAGAPVASAPAPQLSRSDVPAPVVSVPSPVPADAAALSPLAAAAPLATAPVAAASPARASVTNVYTDGSCLRNPGPGGWAVVVEYADGSRVDLSDCERDTTTNRMELQAAVMALRHLIEREHTEPVVLWTDSDYVRNGITKWLDGWKRRNWKKKDDTPVLNVALWKTLDELNQRARARFSLEWKWVRGPDGAPGSDRVAELAKQAAQSVA